MEKKDMTVDVIIPVYRPNKKFDQLLRMLDRQTYPINKLIVIKTGREHWGGIRYWQHHRSELHYISKAEFDHGGTRNLGAGYSKADIILFLTDDAVPQDSRLVEHLVAAMAQKGPGGETVAAVYGRQLPDKACGIIERYTRAFNYPNQSRIKTKKDLKVLGIKTYFASNVCCAYRKDIFEQQGGFVSQTIFNEDMIYAAGSIQAGYAIAYAAEAAVIHSHNLSGMEQFHRNFDLGVSQADHPEVFGSFPSEGEGLRLIKATAKRLIDTGRFQLLPYLAYSSGCKYLGYCLGKRYLRLPRRMVRWCSMNRTYWDKKERRQL